MILEFLKLLERSLGAGVLVLVVLLLRLVLRRAPKWVHVGLWGLVAVRLLCPSLPQSSLSLMPDVSAETVAVELQTMQHQVQTFSSDLYHEYQIPMAYSSTDPLNAAGQLWLLGVLGMLVYMAASVLVLRHRVRTAVRLRENIYQSERVDTPFILGVLFPKIYLPWKLSPEETEHVLVHECTHIRRRDHWWKPLGFGLLSLHWFNPLLWLAYVLLCRDIELACDEGVIRTLGAWERADYTQTLLHCSIRRPVFSACPLAFGEVGVKMRVKSVLNYKLPSRRLLLTAAALCAVAAAGFLTNPVATVDAYSLCSTIRADVDGDGALEYCTAHSTGNDKFRVTVREESFSGPIAWERIHPMPGGRVQFYQEGAECGLQSTMYDGVRVRYSMHVEDDRLAFAAPTRFPEWDVDYAYSNISPTGATMYYKAWNIPEGGKLFMDGIYRLEREKPDALLECEPVKPIGTRPTDGTLYRLLPKREVTVDYDWEEFYGPLERGNYRLCQNFIYQMPDGTTQEFTRYLFFVIH